MPSRYRSGGLGKANLFDTNVKATQIDEDIFTDQEVLTSIADNDLVLLLDVSEDPDEIKYMTKSNLISGLPTLTGSTDNTLVTVTGASAIAGEANLLFDGTIFTNDGGEINIDISSGDPHLSFQIGGTDEFTIGVDDTDSDIFKIDTGGTVGGATKLSIDTSGNVIIAGGITTGSTSFVNSSGVIQVASQTNITGLGTISTGVWQGTAIASAYLDSDTAHLSGTQTISGVKTFSSGFARGSDAEGDILYSNGSAYIRLARGSDDQVLTLASGVPSWATPTVGDITGVTAGVGLSGGGTTGGVTLTLDLSELSDVTPANGDKLSTLDSDGANEQLTTVASLATLFAGTGLTASSSVIGVDTSQAITALTGGDLTIYEDANNADVSFKMGTSATESLSIEVLNGGSNKTAEEIRITTATASATANHGKIAIYIDGAEILDIDDGGIDMASGMTVALNGTDIASASGANTTLTSIYNASLKMGRDSENLIDFATTDNKIILRVNNVDEVELVENALSPVTSDGVALGTGSLMWSDLFLASASVVNFNNGDVVLTHASNLLTLTGGDLTVGVDDTGHDVKFFGASAGAYMLYDQSEDQLVVMGASADATTSTGKLLLATSLTNVNANDVIGKIDFQAPAETGTDAITIAASIQAIAQGTFSASVNATDLIFYTGHSEAATEKFRFTSQGEIGVGGANYGTDGQVLTSAGAGAAPAWEDAGGGGGTIDLVADGAIAAGAPVILHTDGKARQAIGGWNYPRFVNVARESASRHGWLTGEMVTEPSANTTATGTNVQTVNCDVPISGTGNFRIFSAWKKSADSFLWGAVGTVDAATNTIAWGTPAAIISAAVGDKMDVCRAFDSGDTIGSSTTRYGTVAVLTGTDFAGSTNGTLTGNILTIDNSDNSFTVGTARDSGDLTFPNGVGEISCCYDSSKNKVFVATYANDGSNSDGFMVAFNPATNSGTGGWEDVGTFSTNPASHIDCVYDPDSSQNFLVWRDNNANVFGTMATVASDTGVPTVGALLDISGASAFYVAVSYDTSANQAVVAYETSSTLTMITITRSGTTITKGTAHDTEINPLGMINLQYDPDDNTTVVWSKTQTAIPITCKGTISGGNITATDWLYPMGNTAGLVKQDGGRTLTGSNYEDSTLIFINAGNADSWMVYDTDNNKMCVIYSGRNGYMVSIVGQSPYHGTANTVLRDLDDATHGFIGFNTTAVSDGATATITVAGGVNENQTGLTTGQRYYLGGDGSLSITQTYLIDGSETESFPLHSIYAGVATAATKLLVNGSYLGAISNYTEHQ